MSVRQNLKPRTPLPERRFFWRKFGETMLSSRMVARACNDEGHAFLKANRTDFHCPGRYPGLEFEI